MEAPLLPPKVMDSKQRHWAAVKFRAIFAGTRRKWADSPATVPNMLLLTLVFGVVSGVVAWLYSLYFEGLLELVWKVIDQLLGGTCLNAVG
jgi:hypothetical protein